jgi:hypothetical protein
MNSLLKTWLKREGGTKPDITSSCDAENKLLTMAWGSSGQTLAVSTGQAVHSFLRLRTRVFSGFRTRRDVTFFSPMSLARLEATLRRNNYCQLSEVLDGLRIVVLPKKSQKQSRPHL